MTTLGIGFAVSVQHRSPLVAAGVAALLGACPDMRICGADDTDAVPDIIIADYADGLAWLQRMRAAAGTSRGRMLILSHRHREWDVRLAMQAGVYGYLPEHCGTFELIEAVRAIGRGAVYIDRELSNRVAQNFDRTDLTSREHDVLMLMARGCCNKSIARELGIGVGTVKTHVKGVFDKLGATARTHAVVLANQRGLVN